MHKNQLVILNIRMEAAELTNKQSKTTQNFEASRS